MGMKTKGVATLNPGTPDQSWGKCRNLEITDEAEKETITNGDGDTVGIIYSDVRQKVTGEFIPLADSEKSPLEEEDIVGYTLAITLHGTQKAINVVVDTATKSYEAGKAAKFKFDGYVYPNLEEETSTEQGGD
ncbi:MAG: hypothetical protein IKB99_03060 [Lentisphaeria bacterium]|nr:hypothetical protein [Lentisphaeria bacterium]